jgi:DNA invertase Pin-like site-specific DNA recombinase
MSGKRVHFADMSKRKTTTTTTDTRRVVGYIRVSTAKQVDAGHSLEAQRAKLDAYCGLYGLELVGIYADEGASASSMEGRAGLAQALDDVRKGRADGLLVAKLDRLTRSTRDLGAILDECNKRGWALLSVAEQLDTASAAGRLVCGILGVVGQWEREAIAERTSEVMQSMRARGLYTGGKCPYGFELFDGQLEVNKAEQLVIRAVKVYREAGLSLRGIAKQLEKRGMFARAGKPWTAQSIANIAEGGA